MTLQGPIQQPVQRPVLLTAETREHIIVSLWILVTYTQFPKDELLLYPLALYFAYATVRDIKKIEPLLYGGWILLIFPIWSILATIWAVVPVQSLKSGLQVALTMVICFYAAAWLTPRRIMLSVFIAASVIGLLSLGSAVSGSEAAIGVFTHKNVLGANMTILLVTSLCVMLDRGFPQTIRLIAPGMAAIAFMLVVFSQSATGLLLSLAGMAMVLGGAIFVGESSILRLDRLVVLCATGACGFLGLSIIASVLHIDLVGDVLDAVGKNRTITGRTVLWDYAQGEIQDRPLLGVGNGGFWRWEQSPLVRRIFEEFHKSPRHGFTFHNSYYEIIVHLGYVGLAFAVTALSWAAFKILRGLLGFGGMPMVFFATILMIVFARSFVESDLFRQFVLTHMLVWMGALFVVKEQLAIKYARQQMRLQQAYGG
ncbi:MAG: O-antigen ligase family protein [Pseudomonadota bacterium]